MKKGNIILLNGVSSSGKSTLCKELVKLLPNYFHFSIDDFDIVIEKMEDRENERLIPIETEYFFHRSIAMFSDRGVNLIIDQILHNTFTTEDCFKALHDYPVLFVGVHCPLEELERREQARGDRTIGQAKHQLQYVHKNEIYDIEVNTFKENMESCAKRIADALNVDDHPSGWLRTYETYKRNKQFT
jgi:chloramphenicol 3-O phosphotransferase